ncbi:MAG: hypothetical protein AAF236_05890 [Verrucomicrobiota bacterium]
MEKPDVIHMVGGIVDVRDFSAFNSIHGRAVGDQLLRHLKQHFSHLAALGIHSLSGDGDEIVFWSESLEMSDLRKHILKIESQLRNEYRDFQMWCGFSTMSKDTFDSRIFFRQMNQFLPQIKMSNKAVDSTR